MKWATLTGVLAIVLTLESVAIAIALAGALAGTIALWVVLHNARRLETFVTDQTAAVATLRNRVDALEPHRPAG